MLGSFVMGLNSNPLSLIFSFGIALTLPAIYIMLGCGWLFVKTEGSLYRKTILWARKAILPKGLGLFLVSIATPIVSPTIADKWFTFPAAIGLFTIPLTTIITYLAMYWLLRQNRILDAGYGWLIFAGMIIICIMSSIGLAYSIYPDIVIGKLNIWETSAATNSLKFAFYGIVVAVPMIFIYTIFIYKIFYGKANSLNYD